MATSTAGASGSRAWSVAGVRATGLFLPVLLLLFTLSGISGLIYEVVWLRFLTLVFGVTVYAVSTVLTVFMGGLALGGYLAGRFADRLQRPLRAYGLIELAIAGSALLTPPAFGVLNAVYRSIYPALPESLTLVSLVRFVLACVILLVPTTLMGMTLPIVVRSSLGRSASLGTSISLLYACNTAGGILGAYLAAFVLIGSIGVRGTTATAVLLNAAVGLTAIALDLRLRPGPPAAAAERPGPRVVATAPPSSAAMRWLLAAFFVSGMTSLAYQVIWTRILAIFFEATTYAFNLILCTFLLGLAIGSYLIAAVINRKANWLLIAAGLELAIALMAVLSMTAIGRLHDLVDLLRTIPLAEHLVSGEQRATAVMAFITMFPTTVLLGAAFPVIMKLYAADGSGKRLGRAYAANVCGSITGSWMAGFVLIPLLGTERSLILLATVGAVVAGGLLRAAAPRAFRVLAPAGAVLFAALVWLTPGIYRAVFARFGDPVMWYEEGLEQTVTVLQGPAERRMFLNGWHQANDSPGMVQFHSLLGELPVLLQPPPSGAPGGVSGDGEREVLVIGLGGGATAGAAAAFPRTRLEVVELSGSVIRGARFFDHVNGGVVTAPNVRLRTDDGRNYLLLTGRRFDVVMADVIRPQHAGSAALYSLEYYTLARRALKPDGVMIQWIDPSLPENQYRMLLRTFLQAFPYVTAWADGSFVVGSNRPYPLDRAVLAERLGSRAPGAAGRSGLATPDDVLHLFTAADAELRRYAGDGAIVTDDHPYIEFFRSLPADPHPADLSALGRDPAPLLRRPS
jgi:spermidine synthase